MPEVRSTIFSEAIEGYDQGLDGNAIRQSGNRIRKLREPLGADAGGAGRADRD